jgi:hypothetical protein
MAASASEISSVVSLVRWTLGATTTPSKSASRSAMSWIASLLSEKFLRTRVSRTESTVLFPTSRWLTVEMEALRVRNHLEFVDLTERLAKIEAQPAVKVPLPAITKPRGPAEPKVRAVIHAGNGLTWSQITIELTGNQTIHLKAPGQDGAYSFSKRNQLGPEHPLGILMTLAANGEWRNPPGYSADYDRVSKAFQRLQNLLRSLVPLPGKPFQKSAGAFVPIFQVRIHAKLRDNSS